MRGSIIFVVVAGLSGNAVAIEKSTCCLPLAMTTCWGLCGSGSLPNLRQWG